MYAAGIFFLEGYNMINPTFCRIVKLGRSSFHDLSAMTCTPLANFNDHFFK
jgi:hypothetical protein